MRTTGRTTPTTNAPLFSGNENATRVFLSRNDRKNNGYKGYKNGKDAILW